MSGVLIKRENVDIKTPHTQRMPCGNQDKDGGLKTKIDASISQGTPKITLKIPEAREGHGTVLRAS